MRILFVLGNGFDISIGLHTGYQDFYDYYLKQPSGDAVVEHLKNYLKTARYTMWADLEMGLGAYTAQVESIDQMKLIYNDLGDKLRDYLRKEEDSFSISDPIINTIRSGLIEPQATLPQGMQDAINAFRRNQGQFIIDVISFNYTNTLEKILQHFQEIQSMIQLNDYTFLRSVKHIHMRLEDDDVIMGVNDESQILNQDLLNDELRGLLIKPFINQELQNLTDTECVSLIQGADLIYLFGVSIGETDLMWWQTIGNRFKKSDARIVYFAYDKGNITRNAERISKYAACRSLLFNRMGITDPTKEQRDRVFIGYKTRLFHVPDQTQGGDQAV